MVFYRKYRPQTFEDLIGQDHIKLTLSKAFDSKKLAHAYLFCGPRGSGKTSTARILAKVINCDNPQKAPCNECAFCKSITDGSYLDLIEIDAASNRGIDDIRELRDRIKLSPTQGKKKVYIIDEVHMLTTEAFNALLKTLEEPPEHALFILATTEVHKVPQTILSRVQKLEFKLASIEDLIKALKNVVLKEKLEAEDEALAQIAQNAEGSFRDALKLLDQLSSQNGKITLSMVEALTQSGRFTDLVELLTAISQSDTSKSLEIITSQVQGGVNIKEFINTLLETLRGMLFIKANAANQIKDDLGSIRFAQVMQLASLYSSEKVILTIKNLQKSLETLKYTSHNSLPLEVAVMESCQKIEQNFPRETVGVSVAPTFPATAIPVTIDVPTVITAVSEDQKVDSVLTNDTGDEIVLLKEKWNYILETIRPDNYSLEAMLKQAKLLGFEKGLVLLEVPYAFHQRILEAPRAKNLLESVVSDILGKPVRVATKLGKRPIRVEELANVELAQDDEIVRIAAEIFNS